MHFWIDKRSQTCGFGRARVAASLSGGAGVGLGFGHPPRRIGVKSVIVPPIHRLQQSSNDNGNYNGSNNHPNNNSMNSSGSNNGGNGNIHSNIRYNNSNTVGGGGSSSGNNNNHSSNRNNRNRNHNNNNNNNNNHNNNNQNINNNNNNNNVNDTTTSAAVQQRTQQQQYNDINHHYYLGGIMGRHHQNPSDNILAHNFQNRSHTLPPSLGNQECHPSVAALTHLYGGPSHNQELEQGSLGALGSGNSHIGSSANNNGDNNNTRRHFASLTNNNSTTIGIMDAGDSQLLPSHLKCGMWASLVLASVFVAGAKFYFDHQGTGLEVLIFCAFSATFFLAACTVSLCRLPKDLAAGTTSPSSSSIDGHGRNISGAGRQSFRSVGGGQSSNQQSQLSIFTQSPDPDAILINHQQSPAAVANAAPPPPYHIAILLPENNIKIDETPPPSYDKILI